MSMRPGVTWRLMGAVLIVGAAECSVAVGTPPGTAWAACIVTLLAGSLVLALWDMWRR